MNSLEIEYHKNLIDSLTQIQLANLYRFAVIGHLYFNSDNQILVDYFDKIFKEKGGMTPEISKAIELKSKDYENKN